MSVDARLAFSIAVVVVLPAATALTQQTATLPPVVVVGSTPLIGTGIDRDLVPSQSHSLDASALRREGMPDLTGALQRQISGVVSNSASGNPFQPTLLYHGFAASPLQGSPQGLAVYVDGMRFNQPFGDTVYWDLIPDVAIDRVDLVGSNPVFGLNALGGAINVRLKNGFTFSGAEASVAAGSFANIQGDFQFGKSLGNVATYFAASALHQNGWRDGQSSDIQNLYADVGWRGAASEVHFNVAAGHSVLNGPGTTPVELLAVAPRAQFTSPNAITNDYGAASLRGTVDISDSTSMQWLAYYRYFHQHVENGNAPNDTPCRGGGNSGFLCSEEGLSTTSGGALIPSFLGSGQYGQLDTQATRTHAYGATAQISSEASLLQKRNNFVAGASFDGAQTYFRGISYVGGLSLPDRSFVGPGWPIDQPGNSPVSVGISNASFGVYASDTLQITPRLAMTASGRLNATFVNLTDYNGTSLNGAHSYVHFNPAAGLTYRVAPWMTLYAGYAVANRAPTPAELSCAGPGNACSLAHFFVGDPDLSQVVSRTVEAGMRGNVTAFGDASIRYSLGFYRSDLEDDIAFINSPSQGRAFFANIGGTRRQGMDAELQLRSARLLAYLSYSFTDATYQTTFVQSAGNNPSATSSGLIVQPGNRLPGIPAHQLKLGAYYKLTDAWTLGASAVAASGAYLFGDELNLTPLLPGYFTLDVATTYQVSSAVQLFAWAQNVTNSAYYTFGTFSPTGSVAIQQAPGASNPRSYSPSAPLAVYGGLRITF